MDIASSHEIPRITLTEAAVTATLQLQEENPGFVGQFLRIYLAGKGCDGFAYGVTFDRPEETDLQWKVGSIGMLVDADAYRFLKDSVLDWQTIEGKDGFVVENPNHKKFRGKFFKRKNWEERL